MSPAIIDNPSPSQLARREYQRSRTRREPYKYHAWRLLNEAVAQGRIRREECAMCGWPTDTEAHHNDYHQPLEVVWLCSVCHHRHHKEGLDVPDVCPPLHMPVGYWPPTPPETNEDTNEMAAAASLAAKQLATDDALVLRLFACGFSFSQIALSMGMGPKTKAHMWRRFLRAVSTIQTAKETRSIMSEHPQNDYAAACRLEVARWKRIANSARRQRDRDYANKQAASFEAKARDAIRG